MPKQKPVSPIDRALAAVLKGAYKVKGLSQEQLVEQTGITTTTMQRLMAGKTSFDVEQLFAIADAIGWKTAQDYLADAETLVETGKSAAPDNVTSISTRKGDDWQGEKHAIEELDAVAKDSDRVIEIDPDDVTP